MKLKRSLRGLAAGVALALGSISGASADPIAFDQWYTFGFGGGGSALTDGTGFVLGQQSISAPNTPWTFDCQTDHCKLTITDGFLSGDRFEIFDFGMSIGLTSAPVQGADCGNNEAACLASAPHSDRTYYLAAGAHSITGIATDSPFGGGAGFMRVTVPEPGTLALLGLGMLGFALRRRYGA